MWNAWKQLFTSVANKHGPLRTKRVRNKSSPWLTPELKRSVINRNYLKKKAVCSGDVGDWSAYKATRNNINNEIRQEKANYYHNEIKNNSGNGREIWKTINTLL